MKRPLKDKRPVGPFVSTDNKLAAGDVTLLSTVEDSFGSKVGTREVTQLESALRHRSDITIKNVDFDQSVNTYAIRTGLDAVELGELIELSESVEDVIGPSAVTGHSVGFK